MREREGLIARIRYLRRTAALAASPPERAASVPVADAPEAGSGKALEQRVAHLEALLEGLQDSVHRESLRQSRRITELEAQLQPGALAETLSRDARARGL